MSTRKTLFTIATPLAILLIFLTALAKAGPTAVISVTTTDPAANPGDTFCSLVEAIDNANSDSDTSGGDCPAGAGPDTIELGTSEVYTLTVVHNITDGANGLPSITSEIVIEGNGSTIVRSTDGGTPEFRILHNAASGILTLNDLTVKNGALTGEGGGGIRNQGGVLTLHASTVRGNAVADIHGGGIDNQDGTVSLYDSIVENNASLNAASSSNGGGLANRAVAQDATMSLYNTQVLTNTAGKTGGGVLNAAFTDLTATLTISNSLIGGNTADEAAGGVWNTRISGATGQTSLVIIDHSTVRSNTTYNSAGLVGGGGIVNNYGEMFITDSAVKNNIATTGAAFGGGIINALARMTITRSTISGNQALSVGGPFPGGGGGLLNSDGLLTLANTTVSGNSVTGGASGGGIYNAQFFGAAPSEVVLINTTVSDNSADATGGGLSGFNFSGGSSITLSTKNSIVAGNTAPDNTNCAAIVGGSYVSNGNNLEDADTCSFDQPTDQVNTDPLLGPLQDNGGPTWTHALLDGSPAVDAADDTACTAPPVNGVDQRGVARPYGTSCDIGSFELGFDLEYMIYLPAVIR
jgi:hypothetical protein